MKYFLYGRTYILTDGFLGGFQTGRPHRRPLHPLEGEARYAIPAIRTSDLQTALPSRAQSFCVRGFPALLLIS